MKKLGKILPAMAMSLMLLAAIAFNSVGPIKNRLETKKIDETKLCRYFLGHEVSWWTECEDVHYNAWLKQPGNWEMVFKLGGWD